MPYFNKYFKGDFMKLKVLKGKRKRYKNIIAVFLFVILTNIIGILVNQRVKIANLSKKNYEIEKRFELKKTKII